MDNLGVGVSRGGKRGGGGGLPGGEPAGSDFGDRSDRTLRLEYLARSLWFSGD